MPNHRRILNAIRGGLDALKGKLSPVAKSLFEMASFALDVAAPPLLNSALTYITDEEPYTPNPTWNYLSPAPHSIYKPQRFNREDVGLPTGRRKQVASDDQSILQSIARDENKKYKEKYKALKEAKRHIGTVVDNGPLGSIAFVQPAGGAPVAVPVKKVTKRKPRKTKQPKKKTEYITVL